jgi:hypothetical protein
MSSQYFMRVRGRVLGPYDEEKLQSLARRGQLSRMHELSTDGVSWTRASSFPDLFVGAVIETMAIAVTQVQEAASAGEAHSGSDSTTSSAPQSQWFYTSGGSQRGPVDYSQLQLLVASGQLGVDDQVWTDGMPAWVAASAIPGLARSASGAGNIRQFDEAAGNQKLPAAVIKSAVSSRPWAILVAAVIDICAVMSLIGSFMWLIIGARLGSAPIVGNAIVTALLSLAWIVGGLLLHNYCRKLSELEFGKDAVLAEKALDALRAFWVFTGIYLIVLLAFVTVGVVYAFAIGVIHPF